MTMAPRGRAEETAEDEGEAGSEKDGDATSGRVKKVSMRSKETRALLQ
jgi:hypothetical protein